jgi:hypothetical protein
MQRENLNTWVDDFKAITIFSRRQSGGDRIENGKWNRLLPEVVDFENVPKVVLNSKKPR